MGEERTTPERDRIDEGAIELRDGDGGGGGAGGSAPRWSGRGVVCCCFYDER